MCGQPASQPDSPMRLPKGRFALGMYAVDNFSLRWVCSGRMMESTKLSIKMYPRGEEQPLLHQQDNTNGRDNNDELSSSSIPIITIDDAIDRLGMGPFQRYVLLASGLCFASDAVEILLLSFLAIILQSEWSLTEIQTSIIISSVFWGELLGTLTLGPLADMIGRKPVFTITATIIAVFGFATAACNDFVMVLLCRFMVGLGIGGSTVPFDIYAELVPGSHRGSNLSRVGYFFSMGSVFVPLVAWMTLRHDDNDGEGGNSDGHDNIDDISWRVFVIGCAMPCLLSMVLCLSVVPRSPRWLLAHGRHDEALSILRKGATMNDMNPDVLYPPGTKLVQRQHQQKQGGTGNDGNGMDGNNNDDDDDDDAGSGVGVQDNHNCLALLSPRWRSISMRLWCMWGGYALVYYGTVFLTTKVFASTDTGDQHGDDGDNNHNEADTSKTSYSFHYGGILASSSSDVAGVTLCRWLIERYGRVPAQSVSFLGGGISILILSTLAQNVSDGNDGFGGGSGIGAFALLLLISAFCSRMLFMCGASATWVHTAEILTTEIRTTGHGAAYAVGRVVGSISPFLVSYSSNTFIGIVLFVIAGTIAICPMYLPETKGMSMGVDLDCRNRSWIATMPRKQTAEQMEPVKYETLRSL